LQPAGPEPPRPTGLAGLRSTIVDSFTLDKIEFDEVREILAGFCRCSLGSALAHRIGPSRNADIVRKWLDQTSQMVDALREVGLAPLGGIADISDALTRATPGGGAGGEDFAVIASTLETTGLVKAYLAALPESLDELHALAGGIGDFEDEVAAIRNVVESDGTIRDDASGRLHKLRREITQTAERVREVIYGYLRQSEVRKLLQDATVTLHEDRYVLPVRVDNRGRLPGVVHRVSGSGATVFVEPNACVELNNHLADLRDDERAEIVRLLNELSLRLARKIESMRASLRVIAQIDLLSAKGLYAYQFDMVCPTMTADGPLELTHARHPLLMDQAWRQEQAGAAADDRHPVVPIDVRLGSDFDLLVITGSNTGGKTVCLKTVAMLAVMAHSGMHIPAQRGATVPLLRDVLIDIGDEQSLQQSLSTFGAHLKRLKYILHKADRRTLVLLDELGAGTDPDEGGAIGQAVLDELRAIGCRAMATTHLSVLKAYAFNHDRVENASVEFDTDTLSPTYRLHIGTPGESHAITVAAHIGLPARLIEAARSHLTSQGRQFSKAIRATGRARRNAEAARAEAHAARLTAESQADAFRGKLDELDRLRSDFEGWLARLAEMSPGDEVHVSSLNRTGRLVRLQLHKQIALVELDNKQVEVPLRSLMPELGQDGVRRQLEQMRQDLLTQQRSSEAAAERAVAMEAEYRRGLEEITSRQRELQAWAEAIAAAAPGDVVPIGRKPGVGTLVSIDLKAGKATVRTSGGEEMELPTSELFPRHGKPVARAEGKQVSKGRFRKPKDDLPIRHGKPKGRGADALRRAVLAAEPGEEVFVVPFDRACRLVRIDAKRGQVVVQMGDFELQVAISDIRPVKRGG